MDTRTLYLCEATPYGLFSALYRAWQVGGIHDIVARPPRQIDALTTVLPVATSVADAEEMLELFRRRMGSVAIRQMTLCWLSELPGCGSDILSYAALGMQVSRKITGMEAHPAVRTLHAKARRVNNEVHRLMGLLRFRRCPEGYCAEIEPDHNLLPLLAPQFIPRMGRCRWAIHDAKRGLWAVFDDNRLYYTEAVPAFAVYCDDPAEDLWRTYYDTVAIEGRFNPACQKNFMPKRYWKHLVEDPTGAAKKYLREHPDVL